MTHHIKFYNSRCLINSLEYQISMNNTKKPKLIIGIRSSSCDLNAFVVFFAKMPKNTGMAFLLLPPLEPNRQGLIAPLLMGKVNMPVLEAEDNMLVEADHIYILAPGKEITIADTHLHLNNISKPRQEWITIEHFLSSLAKDQGERSVVVILSGTACQSSLGLRDIKLSGGVIIAQDPSTTQHYQKPKNAIDSGLVDMIVLPNKIPSILIKYASHPYLQEQTKTITAIKLKNIYRILAYLLKRIKYDFRGYQQNMLLRRIQRRMCINQSNSFAAYYDFLKANPDEVIALNKDLLIGATTFFRDKDAFKVLAKKIIPKLISHCSEENPIRIWVPACAAGEELYTITMLVFEAFEQAKKPVTAQIFASDIDKQSLKVAREGVYPKYIGGDISSDRLKRFFELTAKDEYKIKKTLRETIIFTTQSLVSDKPFSHLDLIICRNSLIYLQPELQSKVLNTFHFALKPNGVLMLGSSELLGNNNQFETLSKRWRLFKSIKGINQISIKFPIEHNRRENFTKKYSYKTMNYHTRPAARLVELVNRDLLEEYAPAAVLINRALDTLHFQGPTSNFLELPKGTPTHNIIMLLRQGLRTRVRHAVNYVTKENQLIVDSEAKVKRNGHYLPCKLTVRPVFDSKFSSDLLLITFEEKQGTLSDQTVSTTLNLSSTDSSIVEHLKYQLNATREDLQSTVKELEGSNEELKVSNADVMSMNEELQSMNEELNMVNNELHFKVEELKKNYDDTQNLLSSTDIATIFLDRKLQIRLFNPAIGKLLNLRKSDIGRSISDFSAKVTNNDLLKDARYVLNKLLPIEKDVWSLGDNPKKSCYLRRIVPYRTVDDQINGIVITFVEITERFKQKEYLEQCVQDRTKALYDREARLDSIMKYASEAIVVMDEKGEITEFNQAAENIFGYQAIEIIGNRIEVLVPLVHVENRRLGDESDLRVQNKIRAQAQQNLTAIRKNGSKFPIRLTTTLIANDKLCIGIIADLSEVAILKKAITDVSTLEQEKIGRDVHDNLGQRLTGINLLASNLRRNITADDLKSSETLEQIIEQISLAIGETRNISHALSPVLFPPEKLQEALIKLMHMVDSAGIESHFEFSKILRISDNSIAIQVYRIAQEAINNAIKYSRASNITLQLKTHLNQMMLVIEDDGIGIDLKETKADWGIGLKIMQYRASSINASLFIESTPQNGTIVRCVFS